MTSYSIYHNPRCRKSRESLALLQAEGEDPEVILYLDTPPTRERLAELCALLGKRPIEITRTKETLFGEVMDGEHKTDEEMLDILAAHPKLIERPIVVRHGDQGEDEAAVIGRPPELVEGLID